MQNLTNKNIINTITSLPTPGLLQSKRFWFAVFGMVTAIVAYYQPGFEPYLPQIYEAITFVVVTYIGGQSFKDAMVDGFGQWMESKDGNK
jgi:hypothetical protein